MGLNKLSYRVSKVAGYFPLTVSGFILLTATSIALYFRGYQRLDLVALATGVSVLTAWSLFAVWLMTSFLWYRKRIAALKQPSALDLVSGREVFSGFTVPGRAFLPFVQLRWTAVGLEADTSLVYRAGQWREFLRCRRRCLKSSQRRRFTLRDTLGLSSVSWEVESGQSVRVLPYTGRLEQPSILLSLVSGEDISDPRGDPTGDRVDMRQYQRGDPMKFILWKVYSRSGRVMVRVPERALAARPRACCYLLSGPHDEPSAAIARVLIEHRLLGEGWRFAADGNSEHTGVSEEALNRIAESGNVSTPTTEGLERFLVGAEKDGFGFCLILAPPGDSDYAARVLAVSGSRQMQCRVWIGLDLEDSPRTMKEKWLRKLSDSGPLPDSVGRDWKGRASLIERESGHVLVRSAE